ncbi:LPS export ABC transporter permease LptF [Xanthomonadaceae bacterium JHOS43]|nr:LPS export ABC transporter permease LptF [Xanthomonadaceae bacterium JHOS43]MCX7562622.1 LPS export ABC transporter permease LptF [Xanthomonadaceae bacterium XH05]
MSGKVRWPIIDRYLFGQLAAAFIACLVVLVLVSMGGLVADLLSKIARGKLPPGLLISQLGLRALDFLPLLLPLSLFLSVLLAYGRMYRDSEMAVLAAAGLGIRRLARPLAWLAVPVAIGVGLTSLWLSPAALRTSQAMIEAANKSLLVAGLEPGRFVEIPGRNGVVYISQMDEEGRTFQRLFVHGERDGRIDVVTAQAGELFQESQGDERYLRLTDGFRVEGALGSDAFRMMRFAGNDIRLPDVEAGSVGRTEQRMTTPELARVDAPVERAELHWRLATPLATLVLALLALPLAHSPPRNARYGRVLTALLAYLVYLNLLALGRAMLASGTLPAWAGLWWVHLPVVVIALYLLWRDERLPRPREAA